MKIGIFCSANDKIDQKYFEQTRRLVEWLVSHGHSIVFGGCAMGLMGCVAETFSAKAPTGVELIGIVPRLIEENGHASSYLTRLIPCQNLSDRKDLLLEHSDLLIALPGGIGTLDEVFTVAAARTIGYHGKKVVLYQVDDFWTPLVDFLNSLQREGMIRGHWTDYIQVVGLEKLESLLEQSDKVTR